MTPQRRRRGGQSVAGRVEDIRDPDIGRPRARRDGQMGGEPAAANPREMARCTERRGTSGFLEISVGSVPRPDGRLTGR